MGTWGGKGAVDLSTSCKIYLSPLNIFVDSTKKGEQNQRNNLKINLATFLCCMCFIYVCRETGDGTI